MSIWRIRARAWLYNRQHYWTVRRLILRIGFYFRSNGLKARRYADTAKDRFAVACEYLGRSISTIVLAGGTSYLLQFVLGPLAAEWLPPVKEDAYTSILQVIASVTGVFLALHFGGLSAVVGAGYGRAGNNIRALILQERLGAFYVWFLVFVTSLCICLLGLQTLTYEAQALAPIVVVPLAIMSMVAFASLVRVHFAMLDPSDLAKIVFCRLLESARAASVTGFSWDDRSFQNHHQRLARDDLGTLSQLFRAARAIEGESDLQISLNGVACARNYLATRSTIPPSSLWFTQRSRYLSWHLADSSRVRIATATSTSLQPETEPDHFWFEERILDLSLKQARALTGATRIDKLAYHLQAVGALFFDLGRLGNTDDCARWSKAYRGVVFDSMADTLSPTGKESQLAAVERLAMLPINSLLGFAESLGQVEPPILSRVVEGLVNQNEKASFPRGMPLPITIAADTCRSMLGFERSVEGSVRTPRWYLLHQLQLQAMRHIAKNVEEFTSIASFYTELAHELVSRKRWHSAAVAVGRGMEYMAKFDAHLKQCETLFERLCPESNLDNYNLPELRLEKIREDTKGIRKKIQDELVKTIVGLAKDDSKPEELPDLLGEAVGRTEEAIVERMEHNDADGVTRLVPFYFYGVQCVTQRIQGQLGKESPETKVLLGNDVFFNFLELSGLAYAWSEYHQDPELWKPWRSLWDKYLNDNKERVKFFALIVCMKRRLPRVPQGDLRRDAWAQGLSLALHKLRKTANLKWDEFGSQTQIPHASPLIRVIGDGLGLRVKGIDVFVAVYLGKRDDAQGLDFGTDHLTEALDREIRRSSLSGEMIQEERDDGPVNDA